MKNPKEKWITGGYLVTSMDSKPPNGGKLGKSPNYDWAILQPAGIPQFGVIKLML